MYYTFLMLKPDALERQLVNKIIERLLELGINIETFDYRKVTQDIIFEHYRQKINELGEIFKEKTTKAFCGRYVIPMIISSEDTNIISNIRKAIGATDPSKAGPGTIRGDFGRDSLEKAIEEVRMCENLIHASDSYESYLAESRLWFGENISGNFRQ